MSPLEYKFSHLKAISLADHNYPGSNQSAYTHIMDILSSKIDRKFLRSIMNN